MKKTLLGLVIAGASFLSTPAWAAYVSIEALNGAATVATGSFSYNNGLSGVLGYSDLDTFNLTIGSNSYTLADVLPLTDYVQFAYDTNTNSLLVNTNSCGFSGCGFDSILSATNSAGTFGFFFNPPPGEFNDYELGFNPAPYTELNLSAVPEPAVWLTMIVGFGLVGGTLRRRAAPALTAAAAA
jgi:hypothetical protein